MKIDLPWESHTVMKFQPVKKNATKQPLIKPPSNNHRIKYRLRRTNNSKKKMGSVTPQKNLQRNLQQTRKMDQTKVTPKETMVGHQDNPATNQNQECSKKRNVAISIKQEQGNILSSPGRIQKQHRGIETQPLKEIPGRGGT
ncbi:hypothetical protein O181_022587 [Austropuccinia psidii MF-1]|uniref:Uncharacterized protein n=1 Tax=Austropuccinia psidii MF-1 TaxID=1389203 RepID=A0A9Q3CFS1_9BASI|nr:hypothetical protein [Austropuccinia psidii MF-1]